MDSPLCTKSMIDSKKFTAGSNSRSLSLEYCPKVLIVPITPLIGYKLSHPYCGLALKGTGTLEI